ncbi:MAG: substrate-binding domain-containing protein [Alphaproteobacteria bacterium]|nr:substrate-binding domain-containing protein [Alphaproteobacteria bacterium]
MVRRITATLLALLLATSAGFAQSGPITLASTTSTENSGLLGDILPRFTEDTGIAVRVVAVGTGAALNLGRQGDADVLLVHSRPDEDAFVAGGYGAFRRDVMFNDFVIVGPPDDPAAIRGMTEAPAALARIAAHGADFVSRGDDSGTHKAERRLWGLSGVDPSAASGRWYKETGSGMGATLNTASGLGAYTLTDRGTWLSFRNRGGLEVLLEGDPPLFNPYGALLVNPARHRHIRAREAEALIDWLTGPRGQAAIAAFQVNGQQLFFPNADVRRNHRD